MRASVNLDESARTNLSTSKKDLEANTSINPLNSSPEDKDNKRSKKPLQIMSSLKFDL